MTFSQPFHSVNGLLINGFTLYVPGKVGILLPIPLRWITLGVTNLAIYYQPCVKSSSKETKQQKENRRFSSSVPSVPIASPAANIEVKTLVPQNLSKPSDKGKILVK